MRHVCFLVLVACANGGPNGNPPATDATAGDGVDPTGDGGVDAPSQPVTCGGTICVAGQSCNAGTCTFGCVGASVPGDYASLQTAVDALAVAGNDATICIGSATLTEPQVYIRDPANHGKTLQIIGESADKSTINADIYVQQGWGKIQIKGVHVSVPTNRIAVRTNMGQNGKLQIIASRLTGNTGIEISQPQEVSVDGIELVTSGGYGVWTYTNSGTVTVKIENSYFRGTGYSVRASNSTSTGGATNLTFTGNTVIGPSVGLYFDQNTTATVANSIFTGTTSFAMQWSASVNVTRHHNALWNNQTNYGGIASDGASYLKVDCLLDMAPRIPSLRAGSPCRDVGDSGTGSGHDFHGATRGTPPDLGAVESS
jgi:hypothetical protein